MDWESTNGNKYRNDYKRDHYDRYSLMLPKGKKADYMALAEANGMKLNEFINSLLRQAELEQRRNQNDWQD